MTAPPLNNFFFFFTLILSIDCNQDSKQNIVKEDFVKSKSNDSAYQDLGIIEKNKLESISPDRIIARFNYPNIIIYTDSNDYRAFNIRFQDGENIRDEGFWVDALELIQPETFQIDTVRLKSGKYPQLIFRWIQEGYHGYGCGYGGTYSKTEVFRIYDLIKMDDIFTTFPFRNTKETECLDESDSVAIAEETYSHPIDEYYCKFRIQLNKQKKTLIIDNLIRHHNGEYSNDFDNESGTYVFNGHHFELKK